MLSLLRRPWHRLLPSSLSPQRRNLPSTAGSLPAVGLAGLASLAIATALATRRRRAR